jgi:hypothetical protein
LVDFRNTSIVFFAVVHTIIMVKMVKLDSRLPLAKKKPLSANASSNFIRHPARSCPVSEITCFLY